MFLGIKSTAIKFGKHNRLILAGLTSVVVGGLCAAGMHVGQTLPFYIPDTNRLCVANGPELGRTTVKQVKLVYVFYW